MSAPLKHFLGWNQPFVHTASKWLQRHYLQGGLGVAKDVLIVVSGRSVGRRIRSLLVETAAQEGRAIDLPEIVTSSRILKRLLKSEASFANSALLNLTTAVVMRELPEEKIVPIIGTNLRATHDLNYWLSLAKEVNSITEEITSGFQETDPSTWPDSAQALLTKKSRERFESIHNIRTIVIKKLNQDGFIIPSQQWLSLLKEDVNVPKHVVLLGTSDLNVSVKNAVQLLTELGSTVDILIHAPEANESQFDELGCVIPSEWTNATIDIPDDAIEVAGSPSNQANRLLQGMASLNGTYTKDEITVAITDSESIPLIRRQLNGHGLTTRYAGGTAINQSPELKLLNAVGQFIKNRSFDSYASLVRHPQLSNRIGASPSTLHALDRYQANHLPTNIGENWFIPRGLSKYVDIQRLVELHQQVFAFLESLLDKKEHELTIACDLIRAWLLEMYGEEELNRGSKRLVALQGVFEALDSFVSLPQTTKKSIGNVTTSQVIDLILESLENSSIPEYPNSQAIEIVGWLEAMLEDSPCIFILGMDSTLVSASAVGHPSIPNQLRTELGLQTVEKKLARDAHAVTALQYSRMAEGQIRWIVARKSGDGDPLTANPLLMRCDDDDQLAHRAVKLILDIGAESPQIPERLQSQETKESEVVNLIPETSLIQTEPITRLSVTAFKDYIACPYRFWLRRVLGLGAEIDNRSELGYDLFGTLVHGVLQQFGEDEAIRDSTDASEIYSYLENAVDEQVVALFGKYPKSTVKVQSTMAKYRMRIFAEIQAQHALQGWRIVKTEHKIEWVVGTQENPFTIVGKIDRVDEHPDGRVLVLDYKTGSKSATEAHGTKDEWRDLQLPIYRRLIESEKTPLDKIQTGFVLIGSKENKVKFDFPNWDDIQLQCADDLIHHVVAQIQEGNFGDSPVKPAPAYFEDLSWICQDAGIIRSEGGQS